MAFSLGKFLIVNSGDRVLHVRNDDGSKSHTISVFKITASFVDNNLLKIKQKGTNSIITLDFSTQNEAKRALNLFQAQADVLRTLKPFILDKGVKNYVDGNVEDYIQGIGLSYSNGNLYVNANIIPVTGSFSLGSSASLWKELFVSTSSVNIGNAVISSSGSSPVMSSLIIGSGTNSIILSNNNGTLFVNGSVISGGGTGSIGPQGPAGSTGSIGATGSQGIQGPTGPAGAMGSQGPQGENGMGTQSVVVRLIPVNDFESYLNTFTVSLFQGSFVETSGTTASYKVNGYVKQTDNRVISPEAVIPFPAPGPWYETSLTVRGTKKDLSNAYPRVVDYEYTSATTSWPYSLTGFGLPTIVETDVLQTKTIDYDPFTPNDVDFKYFFKVYGTGSGNSPRYSHQIVSNSADNKFNSSVDVNFDGTWTYSFDQVSQGPQGIQGATGAGIVGATGPKGATGGSAGLISGATSSVLVPLMDINSIRAALRTGNANYFTSSSVFSYPYIFSGDIATYSTTVQPGGRPYTQTTMIGLYTIGPIFVGLDQIASHKYYQLGTAGTGSSYVEGSEFHSTSLDIKYYYTYAGPTGASGSIQHIHRFYYDDGVANQDRGDVFITYDGQMTFTYSDEFNKGLEVDNSLQIGTEYDYGFGYIATYSMYLNGTYSNITKPNHSGPYNVYIGQRAAEYISSGQSLTASAYNVALGYSAMRNANNSSFNIAIGYESGLESSNAFNTYIGTNAGRYDKGTFNTYIGTNAGQSSTASAQNSISNTFVGINTGSSIQGGGGNNSFFGGNAGFDNTSGSFNSFFGAYAGNDNTIGTFNSFFGAYSGFDIINGDYNVIVGPYSGFSILGGNRNTFIGADAARNVDFASASIFIGGYGGSGLTGSAVIRNIYLSDGEGNIRYHFDGTQSVIKDQLNIGPVTERYGEWIERFGVYEYYTETGNIFFMGTSSFTPGPTNQFTMDLKNMQNDAATTFTFVIDQQGATAYEPGGIRIEGITQSGIKWANGTYSFNTNSVDILGLTILRTGATTSIILGQTNTFS